MIRNAVVHLLNEQPVVADLFEEPKAGDAGLVCTNLRTLDGRRPVFIDATESTFFFPYHGIRFVELPRGSEGGPERVRVNPNAEPAPAPPPDEEDLEIDEDFLRRIREA